MSETPLENILNFDLAWARVKVDLKDRVFVKHPYYIDLVESNFTLWIDAIKAQIRNGCYVPHSIFICDIPKGNGAVRPGGILGLSDQLVYTACIGSAFDKVHRALAWAQEVIDFSFRFSNDPSAVDWLLSPFEGWKLFRKKSLDKIKNEGIAYVVITDISGYFENIDIKTLMADLRQIEIPQAIIDQLFNFFDKWSIVKGRGLPQGLSPSSILGKLYFNSIDRNLRDCGFDHYRYVDDIRIFCKSKSEAKKAMLCLIQLLRNRGLTIQPGKTDILRADEAIKEIDGVEPILESVRNRFVEQVKEVVGINSTTYMTFDEADRIFNETPDIFSSQVLAETYRLYFIDSPDKKFDKTLFRFLLHRLGKKGDGSALESCFPFLEKHPEHTDDILKYLEATNSISDKQVALDAFMRSESVTYPYQSYQIIEWLARVSFEPSEGLIQIIRRFCFDASQPGYLRAVCIKFLEKYGHDADLERLKNSYRSANSSLEQIEIMCSLRRMERVSRNAFLSEAGRDGELNRFAEAFVKGTSVRSIQTPLDLASLEPQRPS